MDPNIISKRETKSPFRQAPHIEKVNVNDYSEDTERRPVDNGGGRRLMRPTIYSQLYSYPKPLRSTSTSQKH